ncbi:putative spermidine/putrescine transport system substrate-binding protein [Arthrobacter silviterrae]|uniref:ABC transporter substrate-binding protein n=1 Tax=Arthrobacter silviterrae TaxID=2026658 RepID=A0ABX0DAR2_9MICC|nr:ABC transporter substrate-binding protein [Arthrobacter silviterrae]MDQ0278833.1 putative spermidine/putrescine transport system substrate-binding protein [Arthrobacter silviterrae]NGN83999.1 ABC transporter substrate-binding protein [Arthrobacter silviterrae]
MRRFSRRRFAGLLAGAAAALLALSACSAPAPTHPGLTSWGQVTAAAKGQTVRLWMYGGDEQGNAYVDKTLIPAAAKVGVTLQRVPVADTKDALNRVLTEIQAGTKDGSVDLVWVNGDNFGTGKQAGAWLCGWTSLLPNMSLTNPTDPLLTDDFGTPVQGCEAPWSKAQFTIAYNAATVTDPPHTLAGLLDWAQQHPGRFTYPAPPDFTGSAFTREVLDSVSGGYKNVPLRFDQKAFGRLTPALYGRLKALAPSLWRKGQTYPKTSTELNALYAGGQVDFTMTYGPAELTKLVADGTYPAATKVLTLQEGSLGNASFLAIPATSGHQAGAMVVANLALSPQQQAAKADPRTWGQFTVLDTARLDTAERDLFARLPQSPVVPDFNVLSKNANPELAAAWVPALDDAWRRLVLAGQ